MAANKYMCQKDGCEKSYQTISGRRKHYVKCPFPVINLKQYEKVDDGKVKCLRCDHVLSCLTNYYRHAKNVHVEKINKIKIKKVFTCNVCGKGFPSISKLSRHQATHQKISSFKCNKCDKFYSRESWFADHVAKCSISAVDTASTSSSTPTSSHEVICDPSTTSFPTMCTNVTANKFDCMMNLDEEVHFNREVINGDCNVLDVVGEFPPIVAEVANLDVNPAGVVSEHGSCDPNIPHVVPEVISLAAGSDADVLDAAPELDDSNHNTPHVVVIPEVEDVSGKQTIQTYNTNMKRIQRCKDNLTSVVSKIKLLSRDDKENVIRKSLESSSDDIALMFANSPADTTADARFGCGMLNFLKNLDCRNVEKRNLFASLLNSVYGNELFQDDNSALLSWLSKKLDKKPNRIVTIVNNYISDDGQNSKGVLNKLPLNIRQVIFDTWHNNSIVTVDRRDGRDVKRVLLCYYDKQYGDLVMPPDINCERFTSERNQQMIKCTRRISTKTVREIRNEVQKTIQKKISVGSIFNGKPFYIEKPTEREKESCLCKFCLNIRLRFDAYQRNLKDNKQAYSSMSEFFAHGISCERDENGFYQLHCIAGTCKNDDCKKHSAFTIDDFDGEGSFNVNYYQFVVEKYAYMNRKGEKKEGKRTVRKPFTEDFLAFQDNLLSKGNAYLLHRFECRNDVHHWNIIQNNGLGFTYHMDYSENVSSTPKYEPQDSHFSQKQVSLHCTVVFQNDPDVLNYAYHISNCKHHY